MFNNDKEDKQLAKACIKGLTTYACQIHDETSKIEIGELIEQMEGFWGLDKDYRKIFDKKISLSNKTQNPSEKLQNATINGLYRYACEMISSLGAEAESRIPYIQKLMKNIADFWHAEQMPVQLLCNVINISLEQAEHEFDDDVRSNELKFGL